MSLTVTTKDNKYPYRSAYKWFVDCNNNLRITDGKGNIVGCYSASSWVCVDGLCADEKEEQ